MEKIQKHILVDKINKLTIKLKSYAFMRIFMVQTQTQKKVHKIRHYDLQLESAEHISSWMKKKLQQIYLRGFLYIKDFVPQSISLRSIKQVPSPVIEKFSSKGNSIKSTEKFRSQPHQKMQISSYQTTQRIIEKKAQPVKTIFWKQNVVQNAKAKPTHQDSKQSKMKILLDKVRKVNSQSKVDKENSQRDEKSSGKSFENRRVMSSNSAGYFNKIDETRSLERFPQDQSPIRMDAKNHNKTCIYSNNDMSFCKSGRTQRLGSNNYMPIRGNTVRMSQNYTPVTYEANFGQQASMEMIDMISVKRWHRNQKRNTIMAKINALQKSLMHVEYPGQEMYFNSNNENYDDIYTARDYFRVPVNYSEGYLNMRATERPPLRSQMNVKIRK